MTQLQILRALTSKRDDVQPGSQGARPLPYFSTISPPGEVTGPVGWRASYCQSGDGAVILWMSSARRD